MQAESIERDTNALVLRPHPFSVDHGVRRVSGGQTLEAMLLEATEGEPVALTVRVEIGGTEVPRALWSRVRPKAGTAIHVTRMPAGSGNGAKWIRTILMIVVMIVAWYAAPYVAAAFGVSTAVASAAIFMVGSLIVNALVPPPQPKMGGGGFGNADRLNQLTGSQNAVAPYGPIPLVIGECRIFPPHAAMPYSESLGQTSYQRLMFDLGHDYGGPLDPTVYLDVSDLRIGDTPIASYEGVEYEITKTPTLYKSDVNEVSVSAAMNDGASVTRTTAPNVDEISLDIVFPQGLFGMDKKGNLVRVTANINIEYRLVGSGTWITAPQPGAVAGGTGTRTVRLSWSSVALNFQVPTPDRKPFVASYAWGVAAGQYEVRVTRTGTSWGASEVNSRIGDATWSVLRSIRKSSPSKTGTVKLCMRIKASEQLNGPLQTLSCIVRQKIPVYNRGTATWSAPTGNLNTAWVLYWLMTSCPAFSTHVPTSRVDLTAFADFADFCTTNNFETRGVLDAKVTARALIDDILACSLGALTTRDGKYGVLFDSGTTTPVMVFTPLDSKNFTVSRIFTKLPHALRVRFRNPAADWQQDEIVVVDDGYSYRGVDARGVASAAPEPTEFETIELRMAADAHQAWRVARHHFAQAKFRPFTATFESDVANLACTRGDLIHVAHDVTEWGTGWGRVATLAGTALTLDERIELAAATSYSARIRKQDGSSVVIALTGVVAGETNSFTLASSPSGVNLGDVVVIGETTKETSPVLVTGIYPAQDLSARISTVPYDSRVGPYWASPPTTITSEVSGTAYMDPPPEPNIVVVLSNQSNSEPSDGGTTEPTVHIGVQGSSGYVMPPDHLNFRTRAL
ncbi:host specificity factor TipJ family phage tail protein [Lysobacter sp. HA35]